MSPEMLLEIEQEKARAVLPEDIVRYIEDVQGHKHPESYLIPVLHKVQDHFGYLAREQMDAVSVLMQVPAAKVTGVASFYHFFTFKPKATSDGRKLDMTLRELFKRCSADLLSWSEQLKEFVNGRIDPLRKVGTIIE